MSKRRWRKLSREEFQLLQAMRNERRKQRAASRAAAKTVTPGRALADAARRSGYIVDASSHPEDIAMELLVAGIPLLGALPVASASTQPLSAVAPKPSPPKPVRDKDAKKFYASPEWKRARYDALKRHGARCQCCGATAATGARINVDHIRPLKANWHLRLEQSNLQVLCGSCNAGKGNRDKTDWRHPSHV